ncbi:ImuA family protein [Sphingomonas japonica]|uniref:Protein ImuA n=1 Tax=Sphingomonas japonica TaxID=511662 RepID=A0ABX0TYZ7_9SPHN|nr:hypothetical protein [Sphingomonas japonica]NIJ23540.1 protein ImuA [Sphingomonas japonica]
MDGPAESIASLRARIADLGETRSSAAGALSPVDIGAIDAALGGGLGRGCLHEIFAIERDDASSAAGFAAMLARQLGGTLLWLRLGEAQHRGGSLHAPGLSEVGCDPARLILGVLPDPLALLRAAGDIVRCDEVGVAVVELWGHPRALDLTASRRLAIAAQQSGVAILMLRIAAEPMPSAAQTRWTVTAAPAAPLAANAPGRPAFDLQLIRQRGRPAGGAWRVEWNRDLGRFEDPASLSGAVLSLPDGGSAGAGQWRRSA